MITKVHAIHKKDNAEPDINCIEPNYQSLEKSIMKVNFFHRRDGLSRIFLYDFSNIVERINYVQKTLAHTKILPIDSLFLEDGLLTIEWHPCYLETSHFSRGRNIEGVLYFGRETAKDAFDNPLNYGIPTDPTATIIFPPVETTAEWKDRMHRTLSFCAHQLEDALSGIIPQLYHRSDDAHTGSRTTQDNIRVANVSMHARLNIGYLWHQVIAAASELLSTKPKKSDVESQVKKVFENMKSPEHVKSFFHNHNEDAWKKLRHQHSDERSNHRRIHIWQDDFTPGELLLDVNEKNTTNGVLSELDAKAEFHTCATADYKLAASSPNWELITKRVY